MNLFMGESPAHVFVIRSVQFYVVRFHEYAVVFFEWIKFVLRLLYLVIFIANNMSSKRTLKP